jgi:hypothetical protein
MKIKNIKVWDRVLTQKEIDLFMERKKTHGVTWWLLMGTIFIGVFCLIIWGWI